MKRLSARQYQRQVSVTMALYVAAMLAVWPMAKEAPGLWEKVALTLVPALPMLYVIGLMAWKIATSDELEQRTHLIALGAATAVTASSSLVGGLLAMSGALRLDGAVLLWVFPVIMFSYGATHWWVTRRYGGSFDCDASQGGSTPLYLLFVAALLAIATLVGWWRGRMDDFTLGLMSGMVASFVALAALVAFRRRRRRRAEALAGASE
ncbi:MAG: hypothetical protein B7X39_03800 [Lysobacterales bacterium 14-68-21]|jgi:hypothetical protein|nr:MAG: hypothetical protein B7X45_01000 [Xanthomonadales bacterium 15-68-25]OZB67683.1 MAG: hypothetical protein B7X39_03800 [Xanthomonadales bacterium 14-68-21]